MQSHVTIEAARNTAETKLLKDSEKLKVAMQAAQASFSEIMLQIAKDASWSWTEATQKAKLQDASDSLRQKLTPFMKEFLFAEEPIKKKRNKSTKQRISAELQAFLKLEPMVKILQQRCSNTVEAHEKIMQE